MRQDFVTIARTRFGILQTALDRARVMEEKAQSLFLNAAKIGRRRMIKERPSEHARSTSADDAAEKATANADRYVKLSSEIIKRVGSAVVTLTDSSWLDAPVCAGTAVTVTVAPVEEQLFALRTKVDTEIANDIRHLRTLLECIATPEQIAQARERCSSQTRRASMPRAISTDDSEQPSRPEPRRLSRNLSR
ncbi:Cyclic nucleotide-binding domain-containing protein [Plasmodiophora brassicae]